jgi:catechol 2,3-dioxygenase-like lactoylglutathione lyase family enzyme
MPAVLAMDHIVLNVHDMETVLEFYINVLGLQGERLEAFREGKVPFPSVRINADTLIDLFPVEAPLPDKGEVQSMHLNHFCLVVEKSDMPEIMARLQAEGVAIEEGPVSRWGAHGNGMSIYFPDPEGRRIEVRYYEPEHTR